MKNLFFSLCGFYLLCIIIMVSSGSVAGNTGNKKTGRDTIPSKNYVINDPAKSGILLASSYSNTRNFAMAGFPFRMLMLYYTATPPQAQLQESSSSL